MKNLKLLNNRLLSIIIISFLAFSIQTKAEDPVDIWNIKEKKISEQKNKIDTKVDQENELGNVIYKAQSEKININQIEEEQSLISKEIKIVGLYDPDENGLSLDMWSNSDGQMITQLFTNLNKIDLSKDATELLNILLLTNSYYPNKNITKNQFLKIKSDWLIKNSDLKIIEKYLIENQIVNENPELMRHLVNEYLSLSNLKKACEIFAQVKKPFSDNYLSKFSIYCLITQDKINEAQLLLDLKKELGFSDKFYEKKIDYLFGYNTDPNLEISENSILDFHLSHITNPDFNFEPKDTTSKLIWKYLSSSNLLDSIQNIEITDLKKIATIEKATHDNNYTEKDLFELYKRFQFSINQLINVKQSKKLLSSTESRALIYQGILINSAPSQKIELISMLKKSFLSENIENAFDKELRKFLQDINIDEIPSNYTSFYNTYIKEFNEKTEVNIKVNNKILHQSKLLNYFKGNYSSKNIEKEINDYLKKIKRDKKYFFSKKDIIFVEALKSDGVKISEKYKGLYKVEEREMPTDIQVLINNEDIGSAMLRIIEVIGQDQIEDIDDDTMYFVINTLNQLDIDHIRNKLLLKVLL